MGGEGRKIKSSRLAPATYQKKKKEPLLSSEIREVQKPLKVTQEIGEKLNCPEQKWLHFCRAESFVRTLKVFLLGMPSAEHGQVNGTSRDRKDVGQL